MLIESVIRRKNGTRVTIGDETYHFVPSEPNGPHLANVEDEEHIARFLAVVPTSFRVAQERTDKVAPAEPPKIDTPPEADIEPEASKPTRRGRPRKAVQE